MKSNYGSRKIVKDYQWFSVGSGLHISFTILIFSVFSEFSLQCTCNTFIHKKSNKEFHVGRKTKTCPHFSYSGSTPRVKFLQSSDQNSREKRTLARTLLQNLLISSTTITATTNSYALY